MLYKCFSLWGSLSIDKIPVETCSLSEDKGKVQTLGLGNISGVPNMHGVMQYRTGGEPINNSSLT